MPALGRMPVIQRRATRRLSQVYVAYPAAPSASSGRSVGGPLPGQRVPDIEVRAGGEATRLHAVLRGGRPVLVVPPACLASVPGGAWLRPYRQDVTVVTGHTPGVRNGGAGPVILVRPDGYAAARSGLDDTQAVTACLRSLFGQPAVLAGAAQQRGMGSS